MEGLTVISFKENWPGLDKNLRDTNPESYYFHLFKVLVTEGNKGFKHTKIYAATNRGTSINLKYINNQEDSDQARASMVALAKEYNEKYNTGIEIEEDKTNE